MLNKFISRILICTLLISLVFSQERKVVEIPLGGSANEKALEMSSLTWYKDELVLMPQYIDFDDPAFYVIKRRKLALGWRADHQKQLFRKKLN